MANYKPRTDDRPCIIDKLIEILKFLSDDRTKRETLVTNF